MANKDPRYDDVIVTGRPIKMSDNAWGISQQPFGTKIDAWIPFSQIKEHTFSDDAFFQMGDAVIPRWLAEDRDLKYEEMP